MRLFGTLGEALALWPKVFKKSWAWMLPFMILTQIIESSAQTLQKMDERYLALGAFGLGITQMILSILGIIIISQMAHNVKYGTTVKIRWALQLNSKQVLIESLRALVPVIVRLLWLLLLVFISFIPGFAEWPDQKKMMVAVPAIIILLFPAILQGMKLYFIPMIVQFDPQYHEGKVDALQKSRSLFKGRTPTIAVLLILTFVLSILPRLWAGSLGLTSEPVLYVVAFMVSLVLELYSDIVIYCLYDRLRRET